MTISWEFIVGATFIVINGATILAQVPALEVFCSLPDCPGSADLVPTLNSQLIDAFGSTAGTCGDSVCDVYREETCMSCPQDCGGACKQSAPLTHCVKPNHFALTFDDGPAEFTQQALEILTTNNIKATFFVNGYQTVERASDLKAVFDAGHVIGSHTYSHRSLSTGQGSSSRNFTSYPYPDMQGELLGNDLTIQRIIGKYPRFVRPPYLEYSNTSMAFMETSGYTAVNVNVDSNDWRVNDPQDVVDQSADAFATARSTSPSWIHLQHDTLGHSMTALPDIIKNLQAANVEFVAMDECLGEPAYRAENGSPFLSDELHGGGNEGEIVDDVPSVTEVPAIPEFPIGTEVPSYPEHLINSDVPRTPEIPITPAIPSALERLMNPGGYNPPSPISSGGTPDESTNSRLIDSEFNSCGKHGISTVIYAFVSFFFILL